MTSPFEPGARIISLFPTRNPALHPSAGHVPEPLPSATPPAPLPVVIDIRSDLWCWSRLRQTPTGVLTYRVGLQERTRPVDLTVVDDHDLVLPGSGATGPAWPVTAQEVTLEVCGRRATGERWVVRATGVAHRETAAEAGPGTLRVRQPRVRGFRETSIAPDQDPR